MMRMRRFGRRINRAVLLLTAAWLTAWLAVPGLAEDDEEAAPVQVLQGSNRVVVVDAGDIIMGGMGEYLIESIDRAELENYGLLVIEIDTPGGGLDDTQEIVKRMLVSKVPIAVYVTPKGAHAGSAGTFITLAGHVAAMAPGTRIGAAHPVMSALIPDFGGDEKDEDAKKRKQQQEAIMNEKVTNDAAMFMVSIAKERGRNEEWAEKSVRESAVVTSDEAVKIKVVDLEVETLTELLEMIDGREVQIDRKTRVKLNTRGATIDRWKMSLKQRVWNGLANPNVLMLLILIGLGGIAMEFYHPGMIFPGVAGAICLLLAAISIKILPVSAGGVLLVLVGIGLMVAEAYVSSFGLLAIAGAGLLVLGGIFLIDPSNQPHYLDPKMQVDWSVLITAAVTMAGLFVLIGYFVVRTQRGRIRTGAEGMKGEIGEARSDIGPEDGKVFVRGEYWSAVSAEPIEKGAKVVIVKVEGMGLTVKKKD